MDGYEESDSTSAALLLEMEPRYSYDARLTLIGKD
jgi:hypothetical protein